jgi:hypothetical protein
MLKLGIMVSGGGTNLQAIIGRIIISALLSNSIAKAKLLSPKSTPNTFEVFPLTKSTLAGNMQTKFAG